MPHRHDWERFEETLRSGESQRDSLESRLDFLQLTEGDAERLRGLTPLFESFATEFVERFYDHLFEFPFSAAFLQDPERVERLKVWQREHFKSLLEAAWNDEYVTRRRRVGFTHAAVGVEPQYFIGAYNQYLQHCLPHFAEQMAPKSPRDCDWLLSLLKAVFLDIGLTLDAYFLQSTQNLRDALDMFWKANTELRRFAQLTSHDLKTPLATVANLCDEALDEFGDQMPDEARRLVNAAKEGTFRMSRLIDELLASTIAREADDNDAEIATDAALDEALQRIQPVLDKQQIEVLRPHPLPHVWGNRIRLREAMYNVLSNAAKFIDKRPGRITIEAESTDSDVTIAIHDNGPGIPQQELDRVFVPFRRLPNHHTLPGSGLGLYFTKSLVEEQGGRVWAESVEGAGSSFFLQLPRKAPHRRHPPSAEPPARGREGTA